MKIIIPLLMFSAVILHPLQIQNNGMLYGPVGSDDFCYMAQATAWTYGQWPDFSKEKIVDGKLPMGSVGPGLMALPFVFSLSFVDRIQGKEVVQFRSEDNIINSATAWGFILATLFYFGLTLLFLKKLLQKFGVTDRIADWSIVFMILCQGILTCVERRPVFSHVYEMFALTSLLLYLKSLKDWPKDKNWLQIPLGGLLCFLVAVTRYNNIPLAFLWPAIFYFVDSSGRIEMKREDFLKFSKILSIFAVLFFIFKVIPTWKEGHEPYSDMARSLLFSTSDWDFWKTQIQTMLLGTQWGMIFYAPFLLLGFLALFVFKFEDKTRISLLASTLLINLYLALHFGTSGGWYGYRYFMYSAFPVVIIPFAHGITTLEKKNKPLVWACLILCAVPALGSLFLFEGNDEFVLHQVSINGKVEWGVVDYQLKVWKTILTNPAEVLRVVFKGVPVYLLYCVGKVLGFANHLPSLIREKFEPTGISLFLRTVLMLLVPTLPLAILSLKEKREH